MKRAVKFGIFGLGRGSAFYDAVLGNDGDIVAVCDRDEAKLKAAKERLGDALATYTSFDDFINHEGLEAVFVCNDFNQHVPFAIRLLEKGIHVLSECCANATMAEGVALVRAVEKSNAIYMLAENYPFMKFNVEMKRVYDSGSLGKILYAEGEYNHPIDPANDKVIKKLRPYLKHWRNYLARTYYITHSIAPLMFISGATPKRVTAMPVFNADNTDGLAGIMVGDKAAIITTLNDDDSVFKVTGCSGFACESNSYRFCGDKGQVENIRGDKDYRVLLRYNEWNIPEGKEAFQIYAPEWKDKDEALIEKAGHGGGDFIVMREFLDCVRDREKKVPFDVYFSTTMASVGILAHRSMLERGVPYDIPDFRLEEDKKKWENDNDAPFWRGDIAPTLPCCSKPDYKPSEADLKKYLELVGE